MSKQPTTWPNQVSVTVDAARLRQIHHSLFSTRDSMSTPQAQSFLILHGEQLTAQLHKTIREFVQRKLQG